MRETFTSGTVRGALDTRCFYPEMLTSIVIFNYQTRVYGPTSLVNMTTVKLAFMLPPRTLRKPVMLTRQSWILDYQAVLLFRQFL